MSCRLRQSRCNAICQTGKQCSRNVIAGHVKCQQHEGLRRYPTKATIQVAQVPVYSLPIEDTPFECIKRNDLSRLMRNYENGRFSLLARNPHGDTALMYALRLQRVDCARYILHHQTPRVALTTLNTRDTSGRQETALHIASRFGYFDIVCKLVLEGADPNEIDGMGQFPENIAKNNRHFEIVGFLTGRWLKNPWSRNLHKYTPVQFQREVRWCMHTKLFARQPYDVKFLVFNRLLDMYKLDYPYLHTFR